MPLEAGTQFGPYEIISAIWAGGMGEVYKARDTRLDRTVAIKVLPKYVASDPDLAEIATQADVDIVLVGTLLRAGQGIRVSMQLLEAPGGTVLWSHQTQVSLGDLFQLQDEVAQRIVEALTSLLVKQELSQTRRDTPATAQAYEYYLRGNQLSAKGHMLRPDATEWELARDFHRRCVEEDPAFAPAWAQLGHMYRLTEKYFGTAAQDHLTDADAAFQRALAARGRSTDSQIDG